MMPPIQDWSMRWGLVYVESKSRPFTNNNQSLNFLMTLPIFVFILSVVLKVVGVEQEQVGKVAAALQQAREWMRKALVRKERRTAAQDRETEITLLQLSGVLNCVTEISHLLQLLSYFVISWLLLDNILNFDVLPIIHFFQDNLSVVILSQ